MRTQRGILAIALGVAATACTDPSAPTRVRSRLVFDVSAITGSSAALGNGASVAARAEVRVLDPGNQSTVLTADQTLTPTDSVAQFDIELEQGDYNFVGNVYSNNTLQIYTGSVARTIDQDDFLVEIIPQAVDAVMIVSPRTSANAQSFSVRNAGTRPLTWSAPCFRLTNDTTCYDTLRLLLPDSGVVAPNSSITVLVEVPPTVRYQRPTNTTWGVEFTSNVGTVTITATW